MAEFLDCEQLVYRLVSTVDLTPYVRNLTYHERAQELAMGLELDLAVPLSGPDGPGRRWLGDLTELYSPLTLFAGERTADRVVFQGRIYRWRYIEDPLPHIQATAYDPTFSLMKSRDDFAAFGTDGAQILAAIFDQAGAPYVIDGELGPIADQLFRRRTYAEMVASVLYEVEQKHGIAWTARYDFDLGAIRISQPGKLSTPEVYWFRFDESVEQVSDELDLTNFVSQVVISAALSNTNEIDPNPAVVPGDTRFGLFQEILHQDQYQDADGPQKAAKNLLDQRGLPARRALVTTPDVPWLRRGDLVRISAGTLNGRFLANAVDHDPMQRKMQLEVGLLFEGATDESSNEAVDTGVVTTPKDYGRGLPNPRNRPKQLPDINGPVQ